MDFETYYKGQFEADLRVLLGSIPEKHKRTLWSDPSALTIQLDRLSKGDAIEVVPPDRRPLFAVCLCWTVLIDQAMYKYSTKDFGECLLILSLRVPVNGLGVTSVPGLLVPFLLWLTMILTANLRLDHICLRRRTISAKTSLIPWADCLGSLTNFQSVSSSSASVS